MPFAQILEYILQTVLPMVSGWFKTKQEAKAILDIPAPKQTQPEVKVEPKSDKICTLEEYLTACGRYPERQHDVAITDQMEADALVLIDRVTALMTELGISKIDISSGYRPAAVNAATPHAAKRSGHMSCQAVDIIDNSTQSLWHLVASKPELLRKYNLFLEDGESTKGHTNWVHLDMVQRTDRPSRVFKP